VADEYTTPPSPVPPVPPADAAPLGPARRPRRWLVAAIAAATVALVAGAAVVVVLLFAGGPGDKFADASDAFHATVEQELPQVESRVAAATGADLFDLKLREAEQHMRVIADAFGSYRTSLAEIDFAEGVPTARLIEVLTSGEKIVNTSAGFFAKSGFVTFLERLWPQLYGEVKEAEQDVRAEL
jgi:hypothetical protein